MTLNATRRLSLSSSVSPFGEALEGGRQRDQRAHQAERRAGAHQQARALEALERAEVEVGEPLGHAVAELALPHWSIMNASVRAIAGAPRDRAEGGLGAGLVAALEGGARLERRRSRAD